MDSTNNLKYGIPEKFGIPSRAVEDFLNTLEKKRIALHSFILMRHGTALAEGYAPPFTAEKKHRIYSISKSFTSVAVGLMIDEGKLSLTDKVADFFPEYLPENPHPFITSATVRDLLMMSTYHRQNAYTFDDTDWVKTFFNPRYPMHPPGTLFLYDTSATVVLSAIVEKLSGMPFLQYMRPRIFDYIGISADIDCIKSPEGRLWSGSGVLCTTRDLARFAQMCMNLGEWNGKQLVSEEYMRAATSRQIDNYLANDDPEKNCGYGYQFWCMKDGGFACRGMGGQFVFCSPASGIILVTTADTQIRGDSTCDITGAFRELVEKSGEALPENPSDYQSLTERIGRMKILLPPGADKSESADLYSGKTYTLEKNSMGIEYVKFIIKPEKITMNYVNRTGEHEIQFGIGQYINQKFPEKYFGGTIGQKDRHYETIAGASWADKNTMHGLIYAIDDYFGTIKMSVTFSQNTVTLQMLKGAEIFFDEYQGVAWGKCE